MTDISAANVMELRQKTGVSMMECKKALSEAQGDEEKAIEILRKRGAMKAAGKSDRTTAEGYVAISGNAIVSVRCETDFVARNEDFRAFVSTIAAEASAKGAAAAEAKFAAEKDAKIAQIGENITLGEVQIVTAATVGGYVHTTGKVGALIGLEGGNAELAAEVAMHVTALNPSVLHPDDISDELVAKEKAIWADQLKTEGKPEKIWDNIMMGKEKKFREESALVKQPFVKNQEKTIEQYLQEHGAHVVDFARAQV